MFPGRCCGVAVALATLALGGAALGSGQAVPSTPTRPESVAKLIRQLGADDFRSREQASAALEKLGGAVLPSLRKALQTPTELEVKRRLERAVRRIEKAVLDAEEKRWQDLDAPRRGLKERVARIVAGTPALGDDRLAVAIYLVTVGRPPTETEATQARKQLAASDSRLLSALRVARSLVHGKEVRAEIAAANSHLAKAQKDLAGEGLLVTKLARLNGAEFEKITSAVAASLNKVVKTDEQLVHVAFLLAFSRFPNAGESATAVAHLKKSKDRSRATADLVWALVNSREFLVAP
jgi:hypothetical protein